MHDFERDAKAISVSKSGETVNLENGVMTELLDYNRVFNIELAYILEHREIDCL